MTYFLTLEGLKIFLKYGIEEDFDKFEKINNVDEFIDDVRKNKKSCIFETGEEIEFFKIMAECRK